MPDWKNLVTKPEGSLPGGLLTKVMVGLTTVLILALILSTGFGGGGGEEAEAAGEEDTRPAQILRAGAPVEGELATAIDTEQRRSEAQQFTDALEAQRILEDVARAREQQPPNDNPAFNVPRNAPGSGGVDYFPDPDAVALQRAIQLENLERRIRSVRTGPVAQSYRSGNNASTGGGGREPTPRVPGAAPGTDPSALLQSLSQQVPGAGGTPQPGGLDIPLPNSARLPDYENPPRLITPNDPAGWQRVYEGSFLEAVLVNQLDGEFPGPVLAQVSVPFYSQDRQRVLIPRGSRLIGSYQVVQRRDQSRLAVGFHRLILLDGRHVPLRFLGLTQGGTSGLKDQIDRHYLSTFLAAGAVGILSGFATVQGNPYGGGIEGALGRSGQGMAGTGNQLLEPFLNRLPTINIRAGHRLRVRFTSDVLIPRPPPA